MARPPATALLDSRFLARLERLQIRVRRVLAGHQQAERRSRRIGSSLEFADYRTYAPGDDPRRIDWSIFGRLGRLVTRLYEEEEDLAVAILVDGSESMRNDAAKWQLTLELAAALAHVGLHHLDRVGLWFFDRDLRGQSGFFRGRRSFREVVEFLRQPPLPGGGTNLDASLERFVRTGRRRALAIVLSDGFDAGGAESGLGRLTTAGFELHFLQIAGKEESDPGLAGDWLLSDCETGEELRVTVTPALAEAYREEFAAFSVGLRSWCHRHRAGHSLIRAEGGFDEILLHLLRRDGLLR